MLRLLDANLVGQETVVLDPGFNPRILARRAPILATAIQTDQKVLVAGRFHGVGNGLAGCVARLNSDGSHDLTFVSHPGVVPELPLESRDSLGNHIRCMALLPDGKLIIGGRFSSYSGNPCDSIVRLNADGSVDRQFSGPIRIRNRADEVISVVLVTQENQVLVGGTFGTVELRRFGLMRLNSDGTLDNGFSPVFSTDDNLGLNIRAVALQPDKRILVGGNFDMVSGHKRRGIVRLEPDGKVDLSFNPGDGVSTPYRVFPFVAALALTQENNILIGGRFHAIAGIPRNGIARLKPSGLVDETFAPERGIGTNVPGYWVGTIVVQTDGKVVLGGPFPSMGDAQQNVARLNGDGTVDTSFRVNETSVATFGNAPEVASISLYANGDMIAGGSISAFDGYRCSGVVRLRADGRVDPGFVADLGVAGKLRTVQAEPDGKILITGDFDFVNGTRQPGIARLLPDGRVDDGFRPSSGGNAVILRQKNSKYIVDGFYRLREDGSEDPSFWYHGFIPGPVHVMRELPNGKVLIGGGFFSYGFVRRDGLAQVFADGGLDAGFDPGVWGGREIYAIELQADNKILIGGIMSTVNGLPRASVARLHQDGSRDDTFDARLDGPERFSFYCMSKHPSSGEIAIFGRWFPASGGGASQPRIVQLGQDGEIIRQIDVRDLEAYRGEIALVGRETVMIGGSAVQHVRNAISGLGLFDLAGRKKTWPYQQLGVSGSVAALEFTQNGELLVSGEFESVGESPRLSLARLLPAPAIVAAHFSGPTELRIVVRAYPGTQTRLYSSTNLHEWALVVARDGTNDVENFRVETGKESHRWFRTSSSVEEASITD